MSGLTGGKDGGASSGPSHLLAVCDGLTGPFGWPVHRNGSLQSDLLRPNREGLRPINPVVQQDLVFKQQFEVSFIYDSYRNVELFHSMFSPYLAGL